MRRSCVCVALMLLGEAASAQSPTPGGMPPPPGMGLAESAAVRFPQPARVSDLLNRDVLEPLESQVLLGTVQQLVRDRHGTLEGVVRYGGFSGLGARLIAVPVDAMVLLGQGMEIVAYKPNELRRYPMFSAAGTTPIPTDAIIKVGLAKPWH